MQVSVETLKGLERKVTVSVPNEKIEEELGLRLSDLARKVRIDGYRPGKVPLSVVKQRFSEGVRQEIAKDMVQSTLYEALKGQDLNIAGQPYIEPEQLEPGKDFIYTAIFEIFPEFEVKELEQAEVEIVDASVTDADVKNLLEKLREQHKDWNEVSKKVEKGHKVVIDFQGFLDDAPFEGGSSEDYELVIGSNTMIPGFEDQIIGAEPGKTFDIKVTFPEEYQHETLAGKDTKFTITVKQVLEGQLPELDEAFAEKFNIKEGGVEALMTDIKQNMERELERRLSAMNRDVIFDKLMEKNTFDLPVALIDMEIEHLKHDMFHRVFGHEHSDNEKIPDFPRELFEDQAKRRVHLGLLFSEYVKKHNLSADEARVDAMIEKLANAYETPDELRAWYQEKKERLADIEALVMEEIVSEKILEDAKLIKSTKNYDEVMNPKPETEEKNEGAEG